MGVPNFESSSPVSMNECVPAVTPGITRDQMMARHKANHIQVVYAPNEKQAHRACRIKAAMLAELGIETHLCGNVNLD